MFLMLFTGGCKKEEAAPEQGPPAAPPAPTQEVAELPDSAKLALIEQIPIGSNYSDITAQFAGVSPIKPTGVADLGRAETRVEVLDREAILELNFNRRTLYSYYYRLEDLSCPESESLYAQLKGLYGKRYGAGTEENLVEGGYRATTNFWTGTGYDVVATRGNDNGKCRVAWGFQEQ